MYTVYRTMASKYYFGLILFTMMTVGFCKALCNLILIWDVISVLIMMLINSYIEVIYEGQVYLRFKVF